MDIVLEYISPLAEEVIRNFAEDVGLTREPPQKCFKGQLFSQDATWGNIRVAVTEKRNRIAISTPYMNAHMRSFQLLIIAKEAVRLGGKEKPKLTLSQEFSHMDLSSPELLERFWQASHVPEADVEALQKLAAEILQEEEEMEESAEEEVVEVESTIPALQEVPAE